MTNVQSVDLNGKKIDAAFLVYSPTRQRRKDNSFDGNDNVGALVVKDVLTRAGVSVGFCSPETAHKYPLILVSLTSTYDVFAFYRAVAMRPGWQPGKRSFVVLAGGFGMQNPTSIRNYIDYAAFGRVEDWIVPIVEDILGGKIPHSHPSLMFLPDMNQVVISQATKLYQFPLSDGKSPYGAQYVEQFTGCPLKCKFCHYTYARQYNDNRETKGSYVQESLTGGGTPELTWDQLFTWGKKLGRVRVAIDGFSERLRWLYGKKISCDDIVSGIHAVGAYEGNTVVLVYNIANMPTEMDVDRQELYNTLHRIEPKNRVVFVLHSTPFRPSLATPMQWESVMLTPDWSKVRSTVICESKTFRAVHSFTLETPYAHLLSVIAERAIPDTDKLFHAAAFSPYLQQGKNEDRLKLLTHHFNVTPYLREYDLDEDHPAWFLSGYVKSDILKREARIMREEMKESGSSDWKLKGKSLVTVRLQNERKAKKI